MNMLKSMKKEGDIIPLSIVLSLWLVCGALIYGFLGRGDILDEQMEYNEYCEMVKTYHDTNGEFGWPPFRKGEIDCANKAK